MAACFQACDLLIEDLQPPEFLPSSRTETWPLEKSPLTACSHLPIKLIQMATVTALPERVQIEYRGYFAQPVFGVLSNPAALYANLLRHLGPFGATVGGLNINLAVLAQANVSCLLATGFVRLALDHLELFVRDVQNQAQVEELLTAVTRAIGDTDSSLKPIRHDVTMLSWSRMKDEPFSSYIRRFVMKPESLTAAKSRVGFVEVGTDGGFVRSIELEEAADIREDVFLSSVIHLSGDPNPGELVEMFRQQLSDQLSAIELDVQFIEK